MGALKGTGALLSCNQMALSAFPSLFPSSLPPFSAANPIHPFGYARSGVLCTLFTGVSVEEGGGGGGEKGMKGAWSRPVMRRANRVALDKK